MSTDSQVAANQANALKSTGPKTAQGKATARRNALKHGMTCEKENLFSNDAKLYKDRLERWTKAAHPRNDLELYQLASAVRATVMAEHSVQCHAGIRWPHQSWREMHQSRMFSIQWK